MIKLMLQNRGLILSLVRREIDMRYKGSILGAGWFVLNSLIVLAIYTFVFGSVLKSTWPIASRSDSSQPTGYLALAIFSGLLVFNLANECLSRAPSLVVANPNYVKKVVFPLEILAPITLGAALFNTFIAWLVMLTVSVALGVWPAATFLLAPLVILPLLPFILGMTWLLASLGVYVRDLVQAIPLLTTMMLFLAPILYPMTAIPADYRWIPALNPVTLPVTELRRVTFEGQWPDVGSLAIALAVNLIICWLGYLWFTYTKKGFADVI